MSTSSQAVPPKSNAGIAWSLWIPVTLAFVMVSLAWYFIIRIANAHPTQAVPLEETHPTPASNTEGTPQ